MASDLLFSISSTLLAQADGGRGWVDLLMQIEPGKIVLLAIFGSGLVSALGYAISSVIRAANSSAEDTEELQQKIADLDGRLRQLEQRQAETVEY